MINPSPPIAIRRPPSDDGYLSRGEVAALTRNGLFERTSALKPLLTSHARDAERIRKPVDSVWEAIRRTGVFYLFVPKRFGGLELGPEEYFDAMLPLDEGDASTGWAAGFCVHHNWLMALFPLTAQEEFFAKGYGLAPGVTTPPGTATPVEGGYRVRARWRWGSGIMHADWVLGAALVAGAPAPELIWAAIPADQTTVLDTWDMAGMAATGSNDILVEDVFVPAHRTLRHADMRNSSSPGALAHKNPVYRMPMTSFLALAAAIPALGAARAAVAFYRDYLGKRVVFGSADAKHQDRPAAQMRLGQAELAVRTAEVLLRDVARKCVALTSVLPIPIDERIALRGRSAYAVDLCLKAVQTLCQSAGSSAFGMDNPLQRALRDVSTIATHVIFDFDSTTELMGRSMIGLPPNSPLY